MIGDKVTLTCTVENVSDSITNELTYQWFEVKPDGTNNKLETTGKIIMLPPLTVTDAGTYQCVVTCDKLGEWKIESNPHIIPEVKSELSAYGRATLA